MSWNPQVQPAPGFGAQKATLDQAFEQSGIPSSSSLRADVLAAAMCEGTMQPSNQDNSKSDGSTNNSPFNLNTGLVTDLNLQSLLPTLNDNSNPLAQDKAAIQVISSAIEKYGLQGFEEWQRGGQDLYNNFSSPSVQQHYDWDSYSSGFSWAVSSIEANPSSFTDDVRFNPNISYVGG